LVVDGVGVEAGIAASSDPDGDAPARVGATGPSEVTAGPTVDVGEGASTGGGRLADVSTGPTLAGSGPAARGPVDPGSVGGVDGFGKALMRSGKPRGALVKACRPPGTLASRPTCFRVVSFVRTSR
jgi:hypothetical protein